MTDSSRQGSYFRIQRALARIGIGLSLALYPIWWLWPALRQSEYRVGARFSDTFGIEFLASSMSTGAASFWRNHSLNPPDGLSLWVGDGLTQGFLTAFILISSQVFEPVSVLHLLILAAWTASGAAVYLAMRLLGLRTVLAAVVGVIIQVQPCFRWWAVNQVAYVWSGMVFLPLSLLIAAGSAYRRISWKSATIGAVSVNLLLFFIDGYLFVFSVVLSTYGAAKLLLKERPFSSIFAVFGPFVAFLGIRTLSGSVASSWAGLNSEYRVLAPTLSVNSLVRDADILFGNLSPSVGIWGLVGLVLLAASSSSLLKTLGIAASITLIGFRHEILGLSIDVPSWYFAHIPRIRFHDRVSVLSALGLVLATIIGSANRLIPNGGNRVRSNFRYKRALVTVAISLFLISAEPQEGRGRLDRSLQVSDIRTEIAATGLPLIFNAGEIWISGFNYVNPFRNEEVFFQDYWLSRGQESLHSALCQAGVTHVLTIGASALTAVVQATADVAPYEALGFLDLSDRRRFELRARGTFRDFSSEQDFDDREIQLFAVVNCRGAHRASTYFMASSTPPQIDVDGVLVRQVRDDRFGGQYFAISPSILLMPKQQQMNKRSTLVWHVKLGPSDASATQLQSVRVTASGQTDESISHELGSRTLTMKIVTRYPHHIRITSSASDSVQLSYFSMSVTSVEDRS